MLLAHFQLCDCSAKRPVNCKISPLHVKCWMLDRPQAPGLKTSKQIDVSKLNCPEKLEQYQEAGEEINLTNYNPFTSFSQKLYEDASLKLGLAERHQDWFKENEALIGKWLNGKKVALNKLLSCLVCRSECDMFEKDFKECKTKFQQKLREVKDMWWQDKSYKIQTAAYKWNSKFLYHQLCIVYGSPSSVFIFLHVNTGNALLQKPNDNDILGIFHKVTISPSSFKRFTQKPIINQHDNPPPTQW